MPKIIFTKEEIDTIIKMYQEGKTQEEIGNFFNCTKKPIRRILKENNIPTNKRKINRSLKEDYFSNIDNENKAYLLGLLFADGSVVPNKDRETAISLQLLREDSNLLELFRQEINAKSPIQNNIDGTCSFSIRSNKLAKDLNEYNIISNKTYNIHSLPRNIPNKYYKDFLRGYIDGDGSLYFTKENNSFHLSLTSHYIDLVEDYIKIIYNLLQTPERSKNRKPTFYNNVAKFTLNGFEAYKLAKLLYSEATIYCNRKYNKFLEAKKFYN